MKRLFLIFIMLALVSNIIKSQSSVKKKKQHYTIRIEETSRNVP